MKKGALVFLIFASLLFALSFTFVSAEVSIPNDLMSFYAQDVSSFTLSNTSIVLYDTDRTTLYYLYYNSFNQTLNLNISIKCISDDCPTRDQLSFDYLHTDDTVPFVKKAAGVYIMSNVSKLGIFSYEIVLRDDVVNYTQRASFTVTVLSPSLWRQFWHNLFALFSF